MINQMGAYILSVVAAAMAISIIGSVCDQKTGTGKLIRMICGMVLGIRILSGIMQADFRGLTTLTDELFQSADSAITYGNQIASSATSEIIKGETEAYILDKANDLCASINVEVLVSEGEIPIP